MKFTVSPKIFGAVPFLEDYTNSLCGDTYYSLLLNRSEARMLGTALQRYLNETQQDEVAYSALCHALSQICEEQP